MLRNRGKRVAPIFNSETKEHLELQASLRRYLDDSPLQHSTRRYRGFLLSIVAHAAVIEFCPPRRSQGSFCVDLMRAHRRRGRAMKIASPAHGATSGDGAVYEDRRCSGSGRTDSEWRDLDD